MEISEQTNTRPELSGEETFADALDCLIEGENGNGNDVRINSPLQELSSSDLEYSIKVRQKYGLAEPNNYYQLRSSDMRNEAEVIFCTVEKLARRLMDDLLMGRGGSVEEGHVLLKPFLAILELTLCHKYRKSVHDIWHQFTLIKPEAEDSVILGVHANIENVKGFTLLRTGLAKLRAWIRLALMNKTLAVCLAALKPKLRNLYEEGAALIQVDSIVGALKSLDSIDFNLYVREQEIDKMCLLNLANAVLNGKINWAALGCEDISLEDYDHEVEVRKLKSTLVQQINQRSFFQEECRRLQQKCTLVQEQLECAIISSKHLAHENARLQQCIEAHEATNLSLQRQLAATFLGEGRSDTKIKKKAVKIAFEEEKTQRINIQRELEMERQKNKNLEMKLLEMMEGRKQESELFEEQIKEVSAKLELVTRLKDEMRKQVSLNKE